MLLGHVLKLNGQSEKLLPQIESSGPRWSRPGVFRIPKIQESREIVSAKVQRRLPQIFAAQGQNIEGVELHFVAIFPSPKGDIERIGSVCRQ